MFYSIKPTFMKNKLQKILVIILFLVLLSGLFSCYKKRFDFDKLQTDGVWAPDMAVPLIYSDLTFKDILDDYDHNNLFVEDGNGFLYLVYWKNLYSQTAQNLIPLQDENVYSSFNVTVNGSLSPGVDLTAPPYAFYYNFTLPYSQEINELNLKSGDFRFNINAPTLNHNATIQVSIPSATLNGVPFLKNIDYDYTSGTTTPQQLDLSGYTILFDNTGAVKNRLYISYTVTLHGSGGSNNSPYNIFTGESFRDFNFSKITGDFKQTPILIPQDTISVRIFNSNIQGFIDFENPLIHLYSYNSFGIPAALDFNVFRATSGWNPPYDVPISGVPEPWIINAAGFPGNTALTELHLNKNNSNVYDAIAVSPQDVLLNISGITNPGGSVPTNFALDTSRIRIDAKVELPLFGRAWDFVLQDTTNFEFIEDMDKVEFMEFRINSKNGFPVEAIQQMYFLDENNQIIDSMLIPEQQTLSPAPCGGAPDYRVISPVDKHTESRFENNRLIKLENCRKIVTKAKLKTTNYSNQMVKFYSDYSMLVRVGLRIKFKINY